MRSVSHFHRHLSPKLWQHKQLKPIVRLKLFQAALAFYKFLNVDRLIVEDIILTGSNAAYNYTALSDIDIHLIVNFSQTACAHVVENLFQTKKSLWGETYDIKILGIPVELYVEDTANPVRANGIFSILHNHWLKRPSPVRPTTDDSAVRQKRAAFVSEIEDLLSGDPAISEIDALLACLKSLRQNGLMKFGEFSIENMTWKSLRDGGYLQKLHDKRIELRDHALSL